MYCLKCKAVTDSTNIQERISKNNRKMLIGVCTVCGKQKCKFISSKSGQGVFNNVLSKIGNTVGELHLPANQGEYVNNGSFNNQNKYSYCGPGTKYEQRNREGYKGINELDKMCKLHDQFYTDNTDTATRNISDEALAHRAYEISNDPKFDSTQRNMAKWVGVIMKNKARFGLGNSKNLKKGP
jgi:hypothetical protein